MVSQIGFYGVIMDGFMQSWMVGLGRRQGRRQLPIQQQANDRLHVHRMGKHVYRL